MSTKNESNGSNSEHRGGSHEQHVEAGRKGGEARAENSNSHSESSHSGKGTQGGSHEQHVEAGRKGGEAKSEK